MGSSTDIEHTQTETKKRSVITGSILLTYWLCCICFATLAILWIVRANAITVTNTSATQTANKVLQKQATATAAAHSTELAGYELFDPFDNNINRWTVGAEDSDYWTGSRQVTTGVYIWDVRKTTDGFADWSDFPGNDYIKDYDTYVDTKLVEAPDGGNACGGLLFRQSPYGWETGGYTFTVCREGYFEIYYHNLQGWQKIKVDHSPAVREWEWNRLEVQVRADAFKFLINNQVVFETDDDRQPNGGVALIVYLEQAPTRILFDNFGYQSR